MHLRVGEAPAPGEFSALGLHRKQSVLPSLLNADRGDADLTWSKCVWPEGRNGSSINSPSDSKAMTTKACCADSGASRGRTGKGGARNHRKELAQGTSITLPECSPGNQDCQRTQLLKIGQEPGICGNQGFMGNVLF